MLTIAGGVWAVTEPLADSMAAAIQRLGLVAGMDAVASRVEPSRLEARRGGVVAVVPVLGMLQQRSAFWGTSTSWLSDTVNQLAADKAVHAIVLEVDSPGGEVYGVTEAAAVIRAAAAVKPVVASANPFAGSAAYNLASQATEVMVTPSGEVGSIGAYGLHVDATKALEQMGLRVTMVKAGKYKGENHPAAGPLSEEGLAYMQSSVDRYYGMFVADVAKGRGVNVDAVRAGMGQGRMVGAKDAVTQGMADSVGTLDEAIRRASALAAQQRRGLSALAEAQARRATIG